VPFSLDSLHTGIVRLWIDGQSGLLAYAPAHWLVPACWWLTWKRTWPYIVPFLALYLPAAAFVIGWWPDSHPQYDTSCRRFRSSWCRWSLRCRAVRLATVFLIVPPVLIDAVTWQLDTGTDAPTMYPR
jgi:hypothetical protein